MKIYEIWKNPENICVAEFYDLGLAKDFVNYQATLGNDFEIYYDGEKVDLDDC